MIYYVKYHVITVKSRPKLNQLKDVMRCDKTGLMTKWYDLGLELLDGNSSILDTIRIDHQNDADMCCTEMFKKWLACKPHASWDELVTSLDKIEMKTAASDVLKMINNSKLCAIYKKYIHSLEVIIKLSLSVS